MGTLSADTGLQDGRPWPLGARVEAGGVNFALFSAHAEKVELCLLDGGVVRTLPLPACSDQVWHGFLPAAGAGLRYAYRVHGPDGPGHRFAPERLLIDPYARELSGVFSYSAPQTPDSMLWSVVVDERFDWGDDRPPAVPLADSVLYELHVKGATRRHPDVPEALRGTYAGLATPAMIEHFKRLGVTAINLLPVHCFLDEQRLVRSGQHNYWGYNTLGFFALEPRYAARRAGESAIAEFRAMVRALHAEGIEVILDVVYNHTAETDEFGPTIAFRGIDNRSYYRLPADHPDLYENHTGCGNTFNLAHPRVLQLVMDSLRYWVGEMHVDGFRFDLAATLTRDSAFLEAVAQDPLLAGVKLIAEPWDLGPDGYRLGRFLPGWSEWNDRFRDDLRGFWLTREAGIGQLAQRLAGSSEIFRHDGRSPQAGINFITAHDGFTLRDLVSYARKHNELNGENNRDGNDRNLSINCGVEGESTDPAIVGRRRLLQRALLASLCVAQGAPMLQGGDELGRTQAGNNNAYCQDNVLTWIDWEKADAGLSDFVAGLVALRHAQPLLRRRTWLTGLADAAGRRDATWWHAEGRELRGDDWHSDPQETLGLWLAAADDGAAAGARELLLVFNRGGEARYRLPPGNWQRLCDSSATVPFATAPVAESLTLPACSVLILSRT